MVQFHKDMKKLRVSVGQCTTGIIPCTLAHFTISMEAQ